MSKRTLQEKVERIIPLSALYYPKEFNRTVNRILRIVRAEQKRKCRECIDRTVKNIEAREKERLGGKPK